MKIKCGNLDVQLSNWFAAVLPLLYLTGCLTVYCIALVSAACHELGHTAVAVCLKCPVKRVRITPAGFNAVVDESACGKGSRMLLYVCGPAVNFLIAALAFYCQWVLPDQHRILQDILTINIGLAVFNLMPVLPLDGGRILFEALSGYFGIFSAGRTTKKAAIILSILFIGLGSWQLVEGRGNFTLLLIGVFVLVTFAENGMEAGFMNIRQILYRRTRLLKKGIYPTRGLVVMKRVHLGECLKHMDYDSIHLVHVMDDDMTVMAVFSESEIMEAMLAKSSDLSFGELVALCAGRGEEPAEKSSGTGHPDGE